MAFVPVYRERQDYHGGPRYPHLVRNEAARDFLDEILKPRMKRDRDMRLDMI